MYDIELYIEDLSKLIIDFMVTYYTEERQIRIMGKNPNDYTFVPFKGSEFADLEYDIFVDVSSKAPLTRLKEMQDAKELLNMQGQYGFKTPIVTPQEAVKMMQFSNTDQIIERMNMDEMKNKEQELTQILDMSFNMLSQGASPQEVQQAALDALAQMEGGNEAMGSTSNANNVQAAQAGTGL
jgi:hypothetical protein